MNIISQVYVRNALDKALEYPYCEENADKKRILAKFENELIKHGYL